MKIPSEIKIGSTLYTVQLKPDLGKKRYGVTYLDSGVMKISTTWKGKPRSETGVLGTNETFWHEVTHCILYDMGHKLWDDEAFVTAFSRRLTHMIDTAKFKE